MSLVSKFWVTQRQLGEQENTAKDMATFFSQQADVVQLFWRREGKFVWSGTGVQANKQLSSLIKTYLRDIPKHYQYPSFEQKRIAGFSIFEGRHHLWG